jgi:hypothetical protein
MIEEMEKGGKTKQAAVPFDGLRLSLTINQLKKSKCSSLPFISLWIISKLNF